MEKNGTETTHWLDRPVFDAFPTYSREKLILTIIILLTFLSRFMMIGNRGMAHDEVNHVVPAYSLYKGTGYVHDPVTHGPFQFHMLALSYFLLGDSDFSSRIPAAVFSFAAVMVVLFCYRRYLGRIGALVGGFLFLFSPLILFYGRYTRNEAFIELFAVLTFYGLLRYYERRDHFSLYLLAVVTALQFATKETAYIYTAQLLLFCGFDFLTEVWKLPWKNSGERLRTLLLVLLAVALLAAAALLIGTQEWIALVLIVLAAGVALFAIVSVLLKFKWKTFRKMPAFNLIVFIGALILPQLTAFPVKLMGWDPLDYSSVGMTRTGAVLAVFFILSFLLGIWWNREVFLKSAAAFYLIFVTFYTTMFSNGQGFFTGIIGSLGYWLSQQTVARGGQPSYYYWGILIPIYEFAAVAGTVIAIFYAVKYNLFWMKPSESLWASAQHGRKDQEQDPEAIEAEAVVDIDTEVEESPLADQYLFNLESSTLDAVDVQGLNPDEEEIHFGSAKYYLFQNEPERKAPVMILFLFWNLTALLAYTVAGEKMPWLAVHIAMPLALSAAWGIGFLLERIPWKGIVSINSLVALASLICGSYSLTGVFASLLGTNPPFAGKELSQLKATNQFVFSLAATILVLVVLYSALRKWQFKHIVYSLVLYFMALLCLLQARTAYTASFINYDYANEFLVYAHGALGPKVALQQIEEIAARTGQGKSIKVAYDNETRYPYWWYFRDYTDKKDFNETPTRELRDYDIILADMDKEAKLQPIVRTGYYRYVYTRLWWPMQDYFSLTWKSVQNALTNPGMRTALMDIWLNRDFTQYARVTGKTTLTSETWEPSRRMVMYVKNDLLAKMWTLGDKTLFTPQTDDSGAVFEDEKFVQLDPVLSIGSKGTEPGQFNAPRGVAVAPNGDLFVLDSDNGRVERFDKDGVFLLQWNNQANDGLNQPWGIAVSPDNEVYVADTWNHRMLKFSPEGELLLSWNANDPNNPAMTFYGPRSIAIDSTGRVFVSDTGNKRIMVYDKDGNYLNQFGSSGMGVGELDEPVGIALWQDKVLAVADTWNQRVQLFNVSSDASAFVQISEFPVQAWYSQSLDNKPYLAFDKDGNILITDPEGYLIWQFTQDGQLIRSWNAAGGDIDRQSMPCGIAVDGDGAVWVVNTAASQVNRFILPKE